MAPIFYALASLKARLVGADTEKGATIVEYALVLAVISLLLLGTAGVLTGRISALWGEIAALI